VTDLERRLAPYVERAVPRQRVIASLRGWRRPAERTHSGQVAEVSGGTTL
jgi:hypothetical protein